MTPYNLSPKAVERWRNELDQLLAGEEIAFTTDAPHKLAYRLREAIAAAKRHRMQPWSTIDYVFKQETGRVVATPRSSLVTEIVQVERTYPEALNEFDVITTATKDPGHIMLFPNFQGESESVSAWATAKGYTITTDPLTLRKKP